MARPFSGRLIGRLPVLLLGTVALVSPRAAAAPSTAEAAALALAHARAHAGGLGLTAEDLADPALTDAYRSAHNGATHVYFRQRHRGIEVVNGVLNVNVAEDGRILSLSSRFVPDLARHAQGQVAVLTAAQAVARAAAAVGLVPSAPLLPLEPAAGADLRGLWSGAGISQDPIQTRLVYQPLEGGGARLAWNVVIHAFSGRDWWDLRLDATTGEPLSRANLYAEDTYRVFPLPFESPQDPGAGHVTVADPADPVASPFGWHDTNGVAGAEFNDTRGNNVLAQEDTDANNSGGFRPDGGPARVFDFAWDETLGPAGGTNQAAAITNLFYWNNVVHDLFVHYGFDEAAGNFQVTNYSGAGFGGDEVQADAQDGSGTNNANFGTPPEPRGAFGKPRMQMFVWTPPDHRLDIRSPASIAGSYIAGSATFGPRLDDTGVTADLKLADDGAGASPSDACEALPAGFFVGLLAVIDRGTCTFAVKVKNAQNGGAVGAIIVNNVDTGPIALAGEDPTIVIPAVSISKADGATIKTELSRGAVNGTIRKPADLDIANRDSDFDAGVIAHEYGHGISTRLTGGPQNHLCLISSVPVVGVPIPSEQMGEGWSDFFGLVLTAKPDHTATQPRGIGAYLSFQPPDGPGIRNFPYTTDMRRNPQTYDSIKTAAVPHGVGAVWATMIWDMYWNLVTRHGFDPDLYQGGGGNNLALQLVVDGLKLQPCLPSFVDGRNAILLADQINNQGANQCLIWRAFARRGLGVAAVAGSSLNNTDGVQDFTLPPQCPNNPPVANDDQATVAEDSGANTLDVLANDSTAPDVGEQLTITAVTQGAHGSVVITEGGSRVTYTPNANFSGSDSFTYTVKDDFNATDTATVAVTVADTDCGMIDDAHPAVGYRVGWHRIEDARASAGGYHRRMGRRQGSNGADPEVTLVFSAPSLTYHYALSEQGGSADVFLDGQLVETIDYAGPALTFGLSRTFANLGPGPHEFRLRHRTGAVFVDGFSLDCGSGAGADESAVRFDTETSTSDATLGAGLLTLPVAVGAADEELSVVVGGAALPVSVLLLDPAGQSLASGGQLVAGSPASGVDGAVPGAGSYAIVINPMGQLGTVRVSTARTVRRPE